MTFSEAIGKIYGWFGDTDLDVYEVFSKIESSSENETLLGSGYPTIFFVSLAISAIIAFAFYIWPLDHPRFKAWWSWMIMFVSDLAINFGITYVFMSDRVDKINADDEIWSELAGQIGGDASMPLELSSAMKLDFALSNMCVAGMLFIIISMILMCVSETAKFSPFRK